MIYPPVYTLVASQERHAPYATRALCDSGYSVSGPFADAVSAHAWAIEQYGAAYLSPPAFAVRLARAAYAADVLRMMRRIAQSTPV